MLNITYLFSSVDNEEDIVITDDENDEVDVSFLLLD